MHFSLLHSHNPNRTNYSCIKIFSLFFPLYKTSALTWFRIAKEVSNDNLYLVIPFGDERGYVKIKWGPESRTDGLII